MHGLFFLAVGIGEHCLLRKVLASHRPVCRLTNEAGCSLLVCGAVLSAGGVAAARRGLFYGVWLGGVFGLFRNHVASLREQAQMAEEDERRAQVKKKRQILPSNSSLLQKHHGKKGK